MNCLLLHHHTSLFFYFFCMHVCTYNKNVGCCDTRECSVKPIFWKMKKNSACLPACLPASIHTHTCMKSFGFNSSLKTFTAWCDDIYGKNNAWRRQGKTRDHHRFFCVLFFVFIIITKYNSFKGSQEITKAFHQKKCYHNQKSFYEWLYYDLAALLYLPLSADWLGCNKVF